MFFIWFEKKVKTVSHLYFTELRQVEFSTLKELLHKGNGNGKLLPGTEGLPLGACSSSYTSLSSPTASALLFLTHWWVTPGRKTE